jgi:hypothetical protein
MQPIDLTKIRYFSSRIVTLMGVIEDIRKDDVMFEVAYPDLNSTYLEASKANDLKGLKRAYNAITKLHDSLTMDGQD